MSWFWSMLSMHTVHLTRTDFLKSFCQHLTPQIRSIFLRLDVASLMLIFSLQKTKVWTNISYSIFLKQMFWRLFAYLFNAYLTLAGLNHYYKAICSIVRRLSLNPSLFNKNEWLFISPEGYSGFSERLYCKELITPAWGKILRQIATNFTTALF